MVNYTKYSRPDNNYYSKLPAQSVIRIKPSLVPDAFKDTSPLYKDNMINTVVAAPLPETVTVGLANTVGQTWDFWKVAKNLGTLSSTVGLNLSKGIAERQFWQEIEPKDVSVELSFNAMDDARKDVYNPCQMLLKYAAASDVVQTFDFAWFRPVYIDVHIGRIATYYNCIIRSVDVNYSNKIDSEGYPISATVSLTFISRDPVGWKLIEAWTVGTGMPLNQMDVALDQAGNAISAGGEFVLGGLKSIGGYFVPDDMWNQAAKEHADKYNKDVGMKP